MRSCGSVSLADLHWRRRVVFAEYSGASPFPNHAFCNCRCENLGNARPELAKCERFGLRRFYSGRDQQSGDPFGCVSFVLSVRLGTASGPLRRPASAQLLLGSRALPVRAAPSFIHQPSLAQRGREQNVLTNTMGVVVPGRCQESLDDEKSVRPLVVGRARRVDRAVHVVQVMLEEFL